MPKYKARRHKLQITGNQDDMKVRAVKYGDGMKVRLNIEENG